MSKVLILFAHPAFQKSRAQKHLVAATHSLDEVTFHDLYEAYPDFNIDVPHEQQLLRDHDLIVLQHPFYWYSCPALLKEWLDLVLEYGFAYGHQGTALEGKKMLTVITTGGSQDAYCSDGYNRFTIRQFLAPFEQTAVLCGMRYLPPYVVHGMHSGIEENAMDQYAAAYRQLLIGLRDQTFDLKHLDSLTYTNELLEDRGDA